MRRSAPGLLLPSLLVGLPVGLPVGLLVGLLVSLRVLLGCARTEPTTTATVASPSATAGSTSAPATPTPRKIRVKDHELAFLDADDTPGVLIDANAPPPPPGAAPAKHPFLTASCYGGRPDLCSKARDLLLASKSWDEFVARLRGAGFVVEAR